MVARKTEESTGDQVPQLGQYVHSWQVYDEHRQSTDEEEPELAAGQLREDSSWQQKLADRAEKIFETVPLIDRLYRPLKRFKERIRRFLPQRMPPLVARY